ncbi:phosphatidylserine decarboxylase [Aureibacter tunicatorum]|uniref:Phosphatidylserine decarboxylase n=1 Tax=Aureibacter tunicatorum TaxID=866807 RepID=A0AAE3XKZ5_9BACT|nr:phosphatidylserine decarboxylase [Aureibacter tunicatorum]BDD05535.1 hypothetical protein AUTU_30180 [Aureibacter tunicatorum]
MNSYRHPELIATLFFYLFIGDFTINMDEIKDESNGCLGVSSFEMC